MACQLWLGIMPSSGRRDLFIERLRGLLSTRCYSCRATYGYMLLKCTPVYFYDPHSMVRMTAALSVLVVLLRALRLGPGCLTR